MWEPAATPVAPPSEPQVRASLPCPLLHKTARIFSDCHRDLLRFLSSASDYRPNTADFRPINGLACISMLPRCSRCFCSPIHAGPTPRQQHPTKIAGFMTSGNKVVPAGVKDYETLRSAHPARGTSAPAVAEYETHLLLSWRGRPGWWPTPQRLKPAARRGPPCRQAGPPPAAAAPDPGGAPLGSRPTAAAAPRLRWCPS